MREVAKKDIIMNVPPGPVPVGAACNGYPAWGPEGPAAGPVEALSSNIPKGELDLKRRNVLVALVALLLCTTLLTGCGENTYAYVGTIDGQALPAGMYLNLQYNAYTEAEGLVADELDEDDPAAEEGIEVLKQKVEGQSAKAWIDARTEELCRKYTAVDKLCAEKGIVLGEDNRSYMEQMGSYWSMLAEGYESNGISQDTYLRNLANSMLEDELFLHMYGTEGELSPGDDELKTSYAEQNAHLKYIMVPVNTVAADDEESQDLTDEVMPLAEAMEKALAAGKDFEEVAASLEEVYGLLGRTYNADTATSAITDSYVAYALPEDEEDTTYTPEFRAGLKDAKEGDTGIFKMDSIIMVYQVIPSFESEEQFEQQRDSIVRSLYQSEFEDWLADIYNAYEVKWTFGARWYYRPSKIEG